MPITKGLYKCNYCEDEFECDSTMFYKCKCEKSEIKLSQLGFGYSYKDDTCVTRLNDDTFYYKEDFTHLTSEEEKILSEIQKIKDETGYKYHLSKVFSKSVNGEKYLSSLWITYDCSVSNYTSELNKLELHIDLDSRYNNSDIKDRLGKFLSIMKAIENKELDFSKRKDLIKFAENKDVGFYKESTNEFDYIFTV